MSKFLIEQKDFDFKNVEQIDFILFACTFSLGPLFVLVINVIDLRIDGAWFHIIRFLNIAGIVSNAFIIAFTSNWSKNMLCVKNGFSKRLPNNESEQSDFDILPNSSDLKQDSMQKALNGNLESLKEINYIDEFKINEQTRKRNRKNKKYSKLASYIEPVTEIS
ncbi:anoctamin-1 [Brachionus plicatilis]|uniref:Anoctamin-1 n=1 Tax=Brachionus plicatilis TaxID=10195 RepID=A0A3M7PUZ4_BRAPC|nr:anoctamin-1 [Brachionus plicatilis]